MQTKRSDTIAGESRFGSCSSFPYGKYLTFALAGYDYAFPVHKVQEVVMLREITPVPSTPAFIRGLMTLREAVIPVIDLRIKFAMSPNAGSELACVVVVQVVRDTRTVTLGVVVDEVREVTSLTAREIQKTPDFGIPVDVEFILGVVKVDTRVKLLLDIDFLLTTPEIIAVQDVLNSAGDALAPDAEDTDTHQTPAKEEQ